MTTGRSEDMRWQLPHITKDIEGLMRQYEVCRLSLEPVVWAYQSV
jgi:hypothetical protein